MDEWSQNKQQCVLAVLLKKEHQGSECTDSYWASRNKLQNVLRYAIENGLTEKKEMEGGATDRPGYRH